MTSIDDIIKREVNPFDRINPKPTNFWEEKQDPTLTVNSIHQEAIDEIEELLNLVATDHRSRTLLLLGDSGSGKSHLLGRLKHTLNPQAFFAYILCDWAASDHIWRHILRYTIDSLMQVSESQQESQLMLWLKSLSAFTNRNLKQRIFNDNFWEILQSGRQKFIKHLKETYKTARIYNPDIFFGILHDLTNPELYDLACQWLRGDDLSEESMQSLKIKQCIDTEDAAKNILANFGRISTETQPIVLCFDNLDSMPRLAEGFLDIQYLFNVNTTIHGDYLKNFLVIISAITNTWKRHLDRIQPADRAGIHRLIQLKRISLEQAEALCNYQLKSLHQQANPRPNSPIFPLTPQLLEQKFPGGRTIPRYVINIGREEYQRYKNKLAGTIVLLDEKEKIKAEFQLQWQDEYSKIKGKLTKSTLLAASELIRMLQEVIAAVQVQEIKPKLISGKFSSYSLSYKQAGQRERVGIVWTEDASMKSFYSVMNACQKVVNLNLCKTLYLIREAGVGNTKLAGNKIYRQIFTASQHHHITPTLSSVHYLATYHSLVNAVLANELVVAGKTLSLQELEALVREAKILQECTLLQELRIVPGGIVIQPPPLEAVKDFLLNFVISQQFLGRPTLIENTSSQFPEVDESKIDQLIDQLCQENQIRLLDDGAEKKAQLICLVPKAS
jgi:GTPase SAR1 family protein